MPAHACGSAGPVEIVPGQNALEHLTALRHRRPPMHGVSISLPSHTDVIRCSGRGCICQMCVLDRCDPTVLTGGAGERQREPEGRAFTHYTYNAHLPAVPLDDSLPNVQA